MKKILFLFLVALMLVSCDSPVQENDNEEQTVETTQETKVEETKEEPEQIIEEQKPQEEKAAEEQPVEESKEEQPVEETKEEPVEETPLEQPEETKVEEVTEEVEPEKVEEQPEEVTEEQPSEEVEEPKEEPVVIDTWIKVNTTEGDFGIPYFVVPKGYDPMNFERGWISEKFRNTNFIKFVKTNRTLTHKRKDKYKSSTWAFWKGDNTSRTFEAEVDVYEVYIYSNYTEDSAYITYNDLFYNDYDYFKNLFSNSPCYICQAKFTELNKPTLDRIDNKKGHSKDNVKPCCVYCNVTKSNKDENLTRLRIQLRNYALLNNLPMTIDNKIVYDKLRKSITGGLSNVQHRVNIKGKTHINHFKYENNKVISYDTPHVMTHFCGVDFNSLYNGDIVSKRQLICRKDFCNYF